MGRRYCCVPSCLSTSGTGVHLHRIPSQKIANCKNNKTSYPGSARKMDNNYVNKKGNKISFPKKRLSPYINLTNPEICLFVCLIAFFFLFIYTMIDHWISYYKNGSEL